MEERHGVDAQAHAPMLYLITGKAASGKSTLAAKLADAPGHVRISEDAWLARLFGAQMRTLVDYVEFSEKLRRVIGPHAVNLLRAGVSVVLDFPANTVETRAWMARLAKEADSRAVLHYLDVPDDVCKARLAERNAAGTHPFTLSPEQFDRLGRHFVPPTPEEGVEVVVHAMA